MATARALPTSPWSETSRPPPAVSDDAPNGSPTAIERAARPADSTPDPGLYAVLGLDPSVSDDGDPDHLSPPGGAPAGRWREQPRRACGSSMSPTRCSATRVRRDEYDRLRLAQLLAPGAPTPIRPGAKSAARVTRRRRPRHAVQPQLRWLLVRARRAARRRSGRRSPARCIILPRLSINLSALNALQNVLPLPNPTRAAVDRDTPTPSATAAPTATPRRASPQRFAGSSVSVSNATRPRTRSKTCSIKLRRDGQPAAERRRLGHRHSTAPPRSAGRPRGTVKTDSVGIGDDHLQHRRGHARAPGAGPRVCPGRRSAVVLVDDLHAALTARSCAAQADAIVVRAPATSANLGPGFDCLGLALDLWNEVEAVPGVAAERRRRRQPDLAVGAGRLRRRSARAYPGFRAAAAPTASRSPAVWAAAPRRSPAAS